MKRVMQKCSRQNRGSCDSGRSAFRHSPATMDVVGLCILLSDAIAVYGEPIETVDCERSRSRNNEAIRCSSG